MRIEYSSRHFNQGFTELSAYAIMRSAIRVSDVVLAQAKSGVIEEIQRDLKKKLKLELEKILIEWED